MWGAYTASDNAPARTRVWSRKTTLYVQKLAHVTSVSRVMYGNFSCYHSLYGFVVRTRMVLQALWESPILGTENTLSMLDVQLG